MTNWQINSSALGGALTLPPSKSQTLRAILFATLASGTSLIYQYLKSPDTDAMIAACRLVGGIVKEAGDLLRITGVGGRLHLNRGEIDAGNSGIVLRFMTAIAALSSTPLLMTGDHSICYQRPIEPLVAALKQWNVEIISTKDDGFAPLIIKGPINGIEATVEGQDSQFVSALLIAGAFSAGPKIIRVENPGEKPWVDLTLDWFDRLAIPYAREGYACYRLEGNSMIDAFEYHVPGDLSTMAFPLIAGLITGSRLTLKNVNLEDPQGDKKIVEILETMGAPISYDADVNELKTLGSAELNGCSIDVNDCIDVVPILSVAGAFAKGKTTIRNASVARCKECNRLEAMAQQLKKMGANIIETEDGLIVSHSTLSPAAVRTYDDHRVAMALAVAALGTKGTTTVQGVDCVSKTYRLFFQDFVSIGADIKVSG